MSSSRNLPSATQNLAIAISESQINRPSVIQSIGNVVPLNVNLQNKVANVVVENKTNFVIGNNNVSPDLSNEIKIINNVCTTSYVQPNSVVIRRRSAEEIQNAEIFLNFFDTERWNGIKPYTFKMVSNDTQCNVLNSFQSKAVKRVNVQANKHCQQIRKKVFKTTENQENMESQKNLLSIGNQNSMVPTYIIRSLNMRCPSRATRGLMDYFFDEETMVTCSLNRKESTGKLKYLFIFVNTIKLNIKLYLTGNLFLSLQPLTILVKAVLKKISLIPTLYMISWNMYRIIATSTQKSFF